MSDEISKLTDHFILCGAGRTGTHIIDRLVESEDDLTLVLVAHRISSVKSCDDILLLENGALTNAGTFSDLLESSDVFLEIESQQYFLVLSGRWYSTPSLDGPFTYVPSDSLPEDFARIPPESARGSVLVYVAGTDEALDAVLDNSIPQTSAIGRDGTAVPS